MFIYAHPDDIEFGVAGTAAVWAAAGCDGDVCPVDRWQCRQPRGRHVRRGTGAHSTGGANGGGRRCVGAKCVFLGHHDGLLEPTLELRKELVRLIRRYKPNVVVCGDPTLYFPSDTYINHPDHRAAAQVALDAVFPAAEMTLLYPDLAAEGLAGHKVNLCLCALGSGTQCLYRYQCDDRTED